MHCGSFSPVSSIACQLRIVIGHMGEGIPFSSTGSTTTMRGSWSRSGFEAAFTTAKRDLQDHFTITTSGMNWGPALRLSHRALGPERVMFAADYPFENARAAVARIDARDLTRIRSQAVSPKRRTRVSHHCSRCSPDEVTQCAALNASSKIATARVQPADAPRILCGMHEM